MKRTLFTLSALSPALFVIATGQAQTTFFAGFEAGSPNATPNQDVNGGGGV